MFCCFCCCCLQALQHLQARAHEEQVRRGEFAFVPSATGFSFGASADDAPAAAAASITDDAGAGGDDPAVLPLRSTKKGGKTKGSKSKSGKGKGVKSGVSDKPAKASAAVPTEPAKEAVFNFSATPQSDGSAFTFGASAATSSPADSSSSTDAAAAAAIEGLSLDGPVFKFGDKS